MIGIHLALLATRTAINILSDPRPAESEAAGKF